MKKLFILLTVVSCIFIVGMKTPSLKSSQSVLRVGTASGYAPFMSLSPNGTYEGFDKDIIEAVAKKMGKKLILKDYGSMPSLFLALKNERVDAIIWGISITEERKKELDFVHYQGDLEKFVVAFIDENLNRTNSLSDFTSISVEAGSFQDKVVSSLIQPAEINKVDSLLDAALEVKFKRSQCVAMDPSLINSYKEKISDLKIKYFDLPSELQSQGNGIGMNKANPSLTSEIEKSIKELKQEGVIETLEIKWGLRS